MEHAGSLGRGRDEGDADDDAGHPSGGALAGVAVALPFGLALWALIAAGCLYLAS